MTKDLSNWLMLMFNDHESTIRRTLKNNSVHDRVVRRNPWKMFVDG